MLHADLDETWQVPGGNGRVKPIKLVLTGADGAPVQVDDVVLQLVQNGDVMASFDMRYDDGKYMALVRGVPRGTYDLRAEVTVNAFTGWFEGPRLRTR